jgi:hypothetical protein
MRLDQLRKEYQDYVLALRHNPEHFYPSSFAVEQSDKHLVVVAVVKRHIRKNFRIVGVLKRRR